MAKLGEDAIDKALTALKASAKGARDGGGHIWLQQSFDQNGIVGRHPGIESLIFATGFKVDWRQRPMLRHIAPCIRVWKDRYAPPARPTSPPRSRASCAAPPPCRRS